MFLVYHSSMTQDDFYQPGLSGIIFELEQKNAEKIREIRQSVPFFITVIGDVRKLAKYEVEEMAYFCSLQGVIVPTEWGITKAKDCVCIYSESKEAIEGYLVKEGQQWKIAKEKPRNHQQFSLVKRNSETK